METLEWTTCINLFPLHTRAIESGRFLLGIVDMGVGSQCVVDPIGNDRMYEHTSSQICQYLQAAGEALAIRVPEWTYRKITGIPRQQDSVHCGCYVGMYVGYIVETGWLPGKTILIVKTWVLFGYI